MHSMNANKGASEMKKARFQKGQKVYKLTTHFGEINEKHRVIDFMAIIERTVDSCGLKKMTFENHGFDGVYGRSTWSDDPLYFANIPEALERAFEFTEETWTRVFGTRGDITHHHALFGVYTDREETPFNEFSRIKKHFTSQW